MQNSLNLGTSFICPNWTFQGRPQVYPSLFEHIPPNKAYNDHIVKMYNANDIIIRGKLPWEFENINYQYSQKGAGLYSLCASCNNLTGKWYASEYIKIANGILGYILNSGSDKATWYEFKIKDFYPLRFIKQVISMFASTLPETFVSDNEDLKKFIVDKTNNSFNDRKYRLSTYILKNLQIAYTGLQTIGFMDNTIKHVATLDLYPLGFELELNPTGKSENADITELANYDYDDIIEVGIILPVRERNAIFSCDYRTKDEIKEKFKQNNS